MTITAQQLLKAYTGGIFPMAEGRDDPRIFWVDPQRRGILPLRGFHISRSLKKHMRIAPWHVRINSDFRGVLAGCSNRENTWISAEISRLYIELHELNYAHSVEIWHDDQLVGGTYGVALGGAWFGESMFSYRSDASKMALAVCIDRLRRGGFSLFDTQFLTPHLASLGGVEISRSAYHHQLRPALQKPGDFITPAILSLYDVMQRMTQTS